MTQLYLIKKKEFEKPTLTINNLEFINKDKIIQSIGTDLSINDINYSGTMSDKNIILNIYR